MTRHLLTALIAASLCGLPLLGGCDKTLSSKEETTSSPSGKTTHTEEKTVQHPDGSVTSEKRTERSNPNP